MKIQSSEQGVVLVITLIMLSVVTVMAVLFLSVSRRERASVTVTTDHITAKAMTESGFAHAQANIVSRMLTTSNKFNYDFTVSTNFLNINKDGLDVFNPNLDNFENFNSTNVGYRYAYNGRPLNEKHQAINIGNLQFDPRPPVYIQTNSNPRYPLDFRFFLNFNRNIEEYQRDGQVHRVPYFDRSGLLYERGNNRAPLKVPNNKQARLKTHMVGDPQWIGVLEYPNQPHSPTNRFIGRFAYLILPEGKSLDLNAIHNHTQNSHKIDFLRNQGVGPWEMNLAAFLSDLNFNQWSNYIYISPTNVTSSQMLNNSPFNDAYSLLRYRMNYLNDLPDLRNTLDNLRISVNVPDFQDDNIDFFADGPYLNKQSWLTNEFGLEQDNLNKKYWGGDLWRAYYDMQELFDPSKVSTEFVWRLNQTGIRQFGNYSTYDSYTFYRLLSQLGVGSEADEQAETMMLASSDGKAQESKVRKLNLNYKFDQGSEQTKIKEWEPRELFLNLADRLLQASVDSNPPDSQYTNRLGQLERIYGKDHYTIGGTYQRNQDFANAANFSITNFGIQIWPRVHPSQPQYSAGIHQRLQQAANIADIVTTNHQRPRELAHFATNTNGPMQKFPLVFRPQFDVRYANDHLDTRVYITNFVEVTTDALSQLREDWRDLNVTGDPDNLNPDDNVWGIPWVIAAKKGLPNFNEFGVLTAVELTRKLEINKGRRNAPRSFWRTNQMLSLSVSNLFGVELWNSYTRAYPRSLNVRVDVQSDFLMTNQFGTLLVSNRYSSYPFLGAHPIRSVPPNQWRGEEFQLPIFNNRTMLQVTNRGGISPVPSAIYTHRGRGRLIPISWQNSSATNVLFPDNGFPVHRIGLAMTNRVRCLMTDPVTKRVVDFVNLDFVSGLDVQDLLNKEPSGYWIANRLGDTNAPTEGVMKQLLVSLGVEGESDWNSYVGRGAGRDREKAIDLFRAFLGFRPFRLSHNDLVDAYNHLRDPRKSFRRQVPFSPSIRLMKYETLQANDPLVHYTFEDLKDNQQLVSRVMMLKPGQKADNLHNLGSPGEPGRKNQRYRPWPSTLAEAANQYNIAHKDPLIRRSDDWQFPTNKFPNIGWLGRVHRGTPWQTIYLKGYVGSYEGGQGGNERLRLLTVQDLPDPNPTLPMPYDGRSYSFQTLAVDVDPLTDEVVDTLALDSAVDGNKQNILNLARTNWFRWAGSSGTHPTNDWKILELFTTSLNDNASKGLLSVNQAGLAAWSAVFSGVTVQTNMPLDSILMRDIRMPKGLKPAVYNALVIEPAGRAGMPGYDLANPDSDNWQLAQIVNGANGINATRSRFPGGRFRYLGDVLATPALTVQSPFLDWTNSTVYRLGLDDFAVERIPQQVLSLLKADEPRVTIYSYGQSLRPAEGSLRTDPDPIRLLNLCTNYQITGEFAAKRVVRFDGSLTNLNAVVESEIIIPAD